MRSTSLLSLATWTLLFCFFTNLFSLPLLIPIHTPVSCSSSARFASSFKIFRFCILSTFSYRTKEEGLSFTLVLLYIFLPIYRLVVSYYSPLRKKIAYRPYDISNHRYVSLYFLAGFNSLYLLCVFSSFIL